MFKMIESKRLFLKNIESSDQEHVFKGLSNPEVIKYYGISFDSFEKTQKQMDWFKNLVETGTGNGGQF